MHGAIVISEATVGQPDASGAVETKDAGGGATHREAREANG